MVDFSSDKEERLKIAFSKIKEDIEAIKSEFNALKDVINKQEELLEVFLSKIGGKDHKNEENRVFQGLPDTPSIGNQGVQTNKQTNKQTHPKQTNTPIFQVSTIKKEMLSKFSSLPKREFLIFLTIYQLEEDNGSVSYSDLATHLQLSESGVRHYVFNLIKKGFPIQKRKLNNKVAVLSLSPEFKEFNIKKELGDLYLHVSPNQKTLTDDF